MESRFRKLAYGKDPSKFMRIYKPKVLSPNAVMFIFFHGGFWQGIWDLELMTDLCLYVVSLGHVAVNVEYQCVGRSGATTLCPDVIQSAFFAYDSLDRTCPNLPRYIVGHSAGAEIALMFAARPHLTGALASPKKYRAPTKIISLAGITDMWNGYLDDCSGRLSDSKTSVVNFVGMNLGSVPTQKQFKEVSPIEYEPSCDVLLVHGKKDINIPPYYSKWYHSTWKSTGRVDLLLDDDDDHMNIINPAKNCWKKLTTVLQLAA